MHGLAGTGQGGSDYFLGGRDLPWDAVLLTVVVTETSTLTFLPIPGVAYLGTWGSCSSRWNTLVGRITTAAMLLPSSCRGEPSSAYALLKERFGPETRRYTSAVFMATRLLADSVRLFATAIPLALF